MKKVLIIQANFQFIPNQGGELNKFIAQNIKDILVSKGYEVTINDITKNYDVNEEMKKIVDHDIIIFQYPIWWFDVPWQLKKYIDLVFMASKGILWDNDGRSSSDTTKKYAQKSASNKKYMLSTTWNAPAEAFTPGQFLGDKENVHISMHKACEYIGMKKIDTFMCNDVIKNPNIEHYLKTLKIHLDKLF